MQFDFKEQVKKKTDQELREIFIHAKDYNSKFVRLTEEELDLRNINLETSQRIKETVDDTGNRRLSEGKAGSPLYMFLCFAAALLGGVIAIVAGFIYGHSKTTDSEGKTHYVYNEQTRQLGKIMMWLGAAVLFYFALRGEFSE